MRRVTNVRALGWKSTTHLLDNYLCNFAPSIKVKTKHKKYNEYLKQNTNLISFKLFKVHFLCFNYISLKVKILKCVQSEALELGCCLLHTAVVLVQVVVRGRLDFHSIALTRWLPTATPINEKQIKQKFITTKSYLYLMIYILNIQFLKIDNFWYFCIQ